MAAPETLHAYLATALGGRWTSPAVLTLPGGGEAVISFYETDSDLSVDDVEVHPKGTGTGTRLVDALRVYAEQTGRTLTFRSVENPGFFDRFNWLTETDNEMDGTATNYVWRPRP